MDFWTTLEGSAAIEALKVSFFVYPLVNGIHVIAIGALMTSVILMDFRLLGAFAGVEAAPFVNLMRRIALTGFALAVLTGLPMFAVQASDYVENPAFLLKMGLLVVAGFNALAFQTVTEGSRPMQVVLVSSIVLWLGIVMAGRFIGFV